MFLRVMIVRRSHSVQEDGNSLLRPVQVRVKSNCKRCVTDCSEVVICVLRGKPQMLIIRFLARSINANKISDPREQLLKCNPYLKG